MINTKDKTGRYAALHNLGDTLDRLEEIRDQANAVQGALEDLYNEVDNTHMDAQDHPQHGTPHTGGSAHCSHPLCTAVRDLVEVLEEE